MNHQLWIKMANLIFELEKKLAQKEQYQNLERTITRMKAVLEEAGFMILNPLGEAFSDTRTDVEATLVGHHTEQMKITDVLKPIVYLQNDGKNVLVQRGVVLAG